jgi:hypothetical protein
MSGFQKGGLTILALALFLPTAVLAQSGDNDGCSNATLTGDYAFKVSGQILPPGGPAVQREGVAMTHFNGEGKLTQVDFLMSNGVPTTGPTDPLTGFHTGESGWYKVFPDCTGEAEIQFPTPPGLTSGAVIDLRFVLSNHAHTMHTIVSRLLPPGSTTPIPASIHSDAEKLGSVSAED